MRMLKTFQKSLDEDSNSLYEQFKKIHQKIIEKISEIEVPRFRFLINLEIISFYLFYRRVSIAADLINSFKSEFGIVIVEEGVLGKRTKWQEKAVSQFHVVVNQLTPLFDPSEVTHGNHKLPELLKLDDDTRLETIVFMEEAKNELQRHQQ